MEERRMIERAERAYMDLLRWNTGARKLIARRAPEIEMRFRIAREPRRCFRM
jgi:hypothetical protein